MELYHLSDPDVHRGRIALGGLMYAILDIVKDPVTSQQAAVMLDVSLSAVQKALQKNRLRGEQIGRDWLIEREEVERYLRERKMTGPRRPRRTPTD
jgi:excisionase family DNA binding protein